MKHNTEQTPPVPEPDDAASGRWSISGRRIRLAALVTALAVPAGVLAFTTPSPAESDPSEAEVIAAEDEAGDEGEAGELEDLVFECGPDEPLTPEEIAELNAEEEALQAHLDELGIDYMVDTDEDGLHWTEVDWDDEVAADAVDSFWAERYPMTPEDVAEINEDEDALAAHLDELGIDYTVDTDEDGLHWTEVDWDDEVAADAVDSFWAERYPMTPEDVAEINADEEALAAFLDERGIDYSVDTDHEGINWVVWDDEDDAANAAVDEYYEEHLEEHLEDDCESFEDLEDFDEFEEFEEIR